MIYWFHFLPLFKQYPVSECIHSTNISGSSVDCFGLNIIRLAAGSRSQVWAVSCCDPESRNSSWVLRQASGTSQRIIQRDESMTPIKTCLLLMAHNYWTSFPKITDRVYNSVNAATAKSTQSLLVCLFSHGWWESKKKKRTTADITLHYMWFPQVTGVRLGSAGYLAIVCVNSSGLNSTLLTNKYWKQACSASWWGKVVRIDPVQDGAV